MKPKNVYLIKVGIYVASECAPDDEGLLELVTAWARRRGLETGEFDCVHPNFAEDGVSITLEEEGGYRALSPSIPNAN